MFLTGSTHRRGFLQAMGAAGASLLLRGRQASAEELMPSIPAAGDEWLSKLRGAHRQVFDCLSPNGGLAPLFALNFVDTIRDGMHVPESEITAVLSLRGTAMPLALDDATWAKYHIGEALGVKDPQTGEIATRNVFRTTIPMRPGLDYERMLASTRVVMTACNMALTALSGMQAKKLGMPADEAKRDWTAGLLPGVFLVPSGVYALHRSQQAGCTFAAGG